MNDSWPQLGGSRSLSTDAVRFGPQEANDSPLAGSLDWTTVEPAAWLNCWGVMDGAARIVVTPDRSLVWSDDRASRTLNGDGALRLRRGRLETADPAELASLEKLLEVAPGAAATLCLPRRRAAGHLVLRSAVLTNVLGRRLVCVSFHSAGAEFTAEWADVSDIFELTAAEHRVVRGLLNGMSAEAIAADQKVSIYTVRTHISHAYEKLEISCREELWRRMAPYRVN